ncbi:MAG: hypothetical protein U0230_06810 [Polyangiales bacterium]
MTVLAAPTLRAYFAERLDLAARDSGQDLEPEARIYLLDMLVRYAAPDVLVDLDRPLAWLFRDAVEEPDRARRFERFRTLGDVALVRGGFLPEDLEGEGVPESYVAELGARGYLGASALRRERIGVGGPYEALGRGFRRALRLLTWVREDPETGTPVEIVRVFEAYQRGRSPRAARRLSRLGLVPVPGDGKIH